MKSKYELTVFCGDKQVVYYGDKLCRDTPLRCWVLEELADLPNVEHILAPVERTVLVAWKKEEKKIVTPGGNVG